MISPPWRTAALFVLANIVFIGIVYFASTTIMLNTYMAQEQQENRQHISRLLDTFNLKVIEMNNTASGLADNNDLYEYIKGPCSVHSEYSPEIAEFALSHYTRRIFADLHINFLYIAQLDGTPCLVRAYDLTAQTPVLFPQGMESFLHPGDPIVVKALTMGEISGIVVTPQGPVLISAHPILNEQGEGPAGGILVVGQFINDTMLNSVSQATHLNVLTSGPNNPQLPADFKWALSIFQNSTDFYIFRPVDNDTMGNYTVMHDLYGDEAIILRVDTSRALVNNGMRAVRYFNILIAALTIIFSSLAYLFIERGRRIQQARQEVENRLQQTESYYRLLTETIPDWIWEIDRDQQYVYVSPRIQDVLGYAPQEIVGKSIYEIMPPSERLKVEHLIRQVVINGERLHDFLCTFQHKNGNLVSVEANGAAIRDLQGELISYRGVNRDITERLENEQQRRSAEEKLRRMEARYRQMMEQINAVTYLDAVDEASSSLYVSPQVEALFGYKPEEWVADPSLWGKLIYPEDRIKVLMEHKRTNETREDFKMDYRMIARDGRVIWVHDEAVIVAATEEHPAQWNGVLYEITERKNLEEELRYVGSHDALTGLYNRSHFNAELLLLQNNRRGFPVSILMGDMDGLKAVNDTLGHAAGDEQLKLIGQFLRESLRPNDVVARVGGDEYAAILKSTPEATATAIVKRLRNSLSAYKRIHPTLTAGISLGYATGLTYEENLDDVVKRADQMMYQEKSQKKAAKNGPPQKPGA